VNRIPVKRIRLFFTASSRSPTAKASGTPSNSQPARSTNGSGDQRIPAVRIHGGIAGPGNSAHRRGAGAGHIVRVRVSKVEAWLQSGGRNWNEQALKVRLTELLGA
jgi:hypothetical protein